MSLTFKKVDLLVVSMNQPPMVIGFGGEHVGNGMPYRDATPCARLCNLEFLREAAPALVRPIRQSKEMGLQVAG